MGRISMLLFLSFAALCAADCYMPYDCHCSDPCGYQQGVCMGLCASGYYGPRCSDQCSSGCSDCSSYDNLSCRTCFSHTYWDATYGCKCDYGYTGYDCSHPNSGYGYPAVYTPSYDSMHCDPACFGGCSGATSRDCYSCVPHSSLDRYRSCVCDAHWSGDDCSLNSYMGYTGTCGLRCGSCSGPYQSDCSSCIFHSHMDHMGYCYCDNNWSGDDCAAYTGPCHPGCYSYGGCTGPNLDDCIDCEAHSSRDATGRCVCDPGWAGYKCTVYTGACDSHCYGCDGPSAHECQACSTHAYFDNYHVCTCDYNWGGVDCRTYSGYCDPVCDGCNGPYAADCKFCGLHAHWNPMGICYCDDGWGGDDCNVWMGTCDHMCLGCTAPGPEGCISCIEHACKDETMICHCHDYYMGGLCEVFIGECDPKCSECDGPEENQCSTCVSHATYDNDTCICNCDEYWESTDCSLYIGMCDPKCDQANGCNGPSSSDCYVCTDHASFDASGDCVCVDGWGGEDCGTWAGDCHILCNSCYGPGANNCNECVANAHPDNHNFCNCEQDYSGDDCSTYIGPCPDVCNGCSSNSAEACDECIDNAERYQGKCVCRRGWQGVGCDTYTGDCDPKCDYLYGCTGDRPGDCGECNENAYWKESFSETGRPECACLPDYEGEYCEYYIGPCDPKCDHTRDIDNYSYPYAQNFCKGPTASDCNRCVQHAGRDQTGECVCHEYYIGDTCEEYRGPCEALCEVCGFLEYTNDAYCLQCIHNAILVNGRCECNTDFNGDYCEYYQGVCADKCDYCIGPEAKDCNTCVQYAYKDGVTGYCTCLNGYSGDNCEDFDQTLCHIRCLPYDSNVGLTASGCSGPTEYECARCVPHAYQANDLECVCEVSWAGAKCDHYSGECGNACEFCEIGSDGEVRCVQCFDNAESVDTDSHDCQCKEDYGGERCEDYTGECDFRCDNCYGPECTQCWSCGVNAARDVSGICACEEGYIYDSTEGCQWDLSAPANPGECYPTCATCTGPTINDCTTCVHNASRDRASDGHCTCDENYVRADCSKYEGACYPTCLYCDGPYDTDCSQCVANASLVELQTGYNMCVCDDDYGSADCSMYTGECPPTCESCTGPSLHQCSSCVPNAYRNGNGDCVCLAEYGKVADCSVYNGPCDPKCDGCTGPSNADCLKCLDTRNNLDYDGQTITAKYGMDSPTYDQMNWMNDNTKVTCECMDGWAGDRCTLYSGPCDTKCAIGSGCTGPNRCNACRDTAQFTGTNQACECDADWYGDACEFYGGACDPNCINCGGSSAYDCIECVVNAHRSINYVDGDNSADIEGTRFNPIVRNSSMQQQGSGECVCNEHWSGAGCQEWDGPCAPTCDTWTTETADETWVPGEKCSADGKTCYTCVTNSYRNDFGECVCFKDWNGNPECTLYSGKCDPKCKYCNGPTASDCVVCAQNAEFDPNHECKCQTGYVSADCSVYAGTCDDKCNGCNGPTAWDCWKCIDGAKRQDSLGKHPGDTTINPGFIDNQYGYGSFGSTTSYDDYTTNQLPYVRYETDFGRCVCEPERSGAHCEFNSIKCGPTCASCEVDTPSQCTSCIEGYGLFANDCIACHPACSNCSGPENNQCSSCTNGYYLSGTTCKPCNPRCASCNEGGIDGCTQCRAGMVMTLAVSGYNGTCTCADSHDSWYAYFTPFNRDACVFECAYGTISTDDTCTESNDANTQFPFWTGTTPFARRLEPTLNERFDQVLGNILLDGNGWEYNRGAYVSKYDSAAQIIELQGVGGLYRFSLMFRLDDVGGTIFHMRHEWNNAWSRYANYECFPYEDCFDNEKWGDIEIWQTPCGEIVFDMPGFSHKFEAKYFKENDWNRVHIDQWSYWDTDLTDDAADCQFAVRYTVGLNDETYEAPVDGNWVLSVDHYERTPSTQVAFPARTLWSLGGYAFWDDILLEEYFTIHKAAGFYTYAHWDNDYTGYKNNFTTFTTFINNDVGDASDCIAPVDFTDGDANTITINMCYSPCGLGQYPDNSSDASSCADCMDSCDGQVCFDATNECNLCTDPACVQCFSNPNECKRCRAPFMLNTTTSTCYCPATYVQLSDSTCVPPCTAGCASCLTPEINHCYVCEDGFRLDAEFGLGRCLPCNQESESEFGFGSCGFKAHHMETGECVCATNEWWDADHQMCRTCAANCTKCTENFICDQCEDGFLLADEASTCHEYCATGFEPDYETNTCKGTYGLVADFIFDCEGTTMMTSDFAWHDSRSIDGHRYAVDIFRGAGGRYETAEPYLIDDRGLFFDGVNDFMTVKGLVIHHTFSMTFWMNPTTSGTLYSSATINDDKFEQFWAIRLEGKRLNFVDASNNYETSTNEIFNVLDWQHLAFTANWEETERKTYISVYRDGKPRERQSFDFIITDYRDKDDRRWLSDDIGLFNRHLIGATEFRERVKNMYTGFIYQFTYSNHEVSNYSSQVRHHCGECEVCPHVGCLGECGAYKHPYDDKCLNCPGFCTRGCQSDGTC